MGKSKIDKMREKGVKTCPASRHAHMIVDGLRSKGGYGKLLRDAGYDPNHMAESIESVVMSLWDARQYLEWEALPPTKGRPYNGRWVPIAAACKDHGQSPC